MVIVFSIPLTRHILRIAPTCFPQNIIAFCTLAPLSYKEGTDIGHISKKRLEEKYSPKSPVLWLNQVHGANVLQLPPKTTVESADAVFTHDDHVLCAVRTADCLPILICSKDGEKIAAVHAGWRGLHAEIIKKTIVEMNCPPSQLLVWLGPAICQEHFEVGEEVYHQFFELDQNNAPAFIPKANKKYLADLYQIARLQLETIGVWKESLYGGTYCTFHDKKYHSHRRDGESAGRMVSCIMKT